MTAEVVRVGGLAVVCRISRQRSLGLRRGGEGGRRVPSAWFFEQLVDRRVCR
jgi:hypothetical protein